MISPRNIPNICRFNLLLLLMLGLSACGGRIDRPTPTSGTAQQRVDFDEAVRAFDADKIMPARRRFERLLKTADSDLRPYVTYYLARIEARKRPANGAEALLGLANTNAPVELRQAAALHGSVAAARAGSCDRVRPDAHRLVQRVTGSDRADAELGLAECAKGATALARYKAAAEADPTRAPQAQAKAEALVAKTRQPDQRMIDVWPELFVGHQGLPSPATDPDNPLPQPIPISAGRARIGLLVPLSGDLRALGERLATGVEATNGGEDDPNGPGPVIIVRDSARAGDLDAAFDHFASEGTFAVVGLFDRTVAPKAAEAAATRRMPLVMLTSSDAAVAVEGPIWRALHTPSLVGRTAAGAGLMRGGRRAAVMRPQSTYGATLGRWFSESWKAGGGTIAGELTWNPAQPNWARLAKRAQRLKFDTLFLPTDDRSGAQLLSHLAAQGTWVRSARSRFKGTPNDAREVWVIGTPEWYGPALLKQARRYAEGLMVPVPFAVETARGAAFAENLQRRAGNPATALDALIADTIHAFKQAYAVAASDGLDATSALQRIRWEGGHTAGLDFSKSDRDAVQALFLLVVSEGRFTPLQ